jgi:hypothetical protein
MGNARKPHRDDQDNDGRPDDSQSQSQVHAGPDTDGDGIPERETSIESDPVMINN